MTAPVDGNAAPFREWCIVEMLGHRRLAGLVQEVQIAGQGMLRIDIPEADGDPARTQYVAPASIYALHPVTQATAHRAAAAWRPEPVQRWELAALDMAQPPKPTFDDEGVDADGWGEGEEDGDDQRQTSQPLGIVRRACGCTADTVTGENIVCDRHTGVAHG